MVAYVEFEVVGFYLRIFFLLLFDDFRLASSSRLLYGLGACCYHDEATLIGMMYERQPLNV